MPAEEQTSGVMGSKNGLFWPSLLILRHHIFITQQCYDILLFSLSYFAVSSPLLMVVLEHRNI